MHGSRDAVGHRSPSGRTVWTYWEQGLDEAPAIVRLCVRSWELRNPTWNVRVLDRRTVEGETGRPAWDFDRPDVTVQKRANLIRLMLLARHGGVWADATTYCWRPLDEWLPPTNFFAFRRPGRDRLLANWFLAGSPGSPLLEALLDGYVNVFAGRTFDRIHDPQTRELMKGLRRVYCKDVESTLFWTSPWALDHLGAYPYFIFHYVFNTIVLTNPELARQWAAVPETEAAPCFAVRRLADGSPREALAAAALDTAPVQKLSWREPFDTPYWRVVLREFEDRLEAPA